jgi:hypothetical protein
VNSIADSVLPPLTHVVVLPNLSPAFERDGRHSVAPQGIKLMVNRFVVLLVGIFLSAASIADDSKVHFVGDFESGGVGSNGATHDGFYLATLPDPQSGDEYLHNGESNFGPTSKADTRVVRSETVGGETITPRKGQYFLRSEIFRTKNYLALNNYAKNRPRSKVYMSSPQHRFDFDAEGYVGFSIFTPKNFESELGVRDHRGSITLFTTTSDATEQLVDLSQWVESPATEAHWFVRYWTVADNGKGDTTIKVVDLGPVRLDAGKWTDFVFRYRFNPFSVDTNPAAAGIRGARDQLYQGNKGILQIWKAEGAVDSDGNRQMVLKIDKVNTPVGLVPPATDKIAHRWRIYKFGWLSNPTTLTHSVWMGFDEIRQGMVMRDGTTFADVAPSRVACGSGCGEAEPAKPRPPSSVTIN